VSTEDHGEDVRAFYDRLGEREWDRLVSSPRARVSLEVHRRFLADWVQPGWRVLEVGAGPGRFTLELARLGATVVVTDVSSVQLELNATHVRDSPFEGSVERRELVDVRDTSRYAEGEFDAVLAFGGPLSYAFEQLDSAVSGLLRITRNGGPVIASVLSLLGTWRFFLSDVMSTAARAGVDAHEALLRTGDLRHIATGPDDHICQMFRWSELERLASRHQAVMLAGCASNFASLGNQESLTQIERDRAGWARFLDAEADACREPGARDSGTHILFALARHES
jgi:SAM-dependent methyltransferase